MFARDCGMVGIAVEQNDSALGKWITAKWSPARDSELAGIVERIWYFDGRTARSRERAFPDALALLIVQFDEPYGDANCDGSPFPAVCIAGLQTKSTVIIAPGGRSRVLGIGLTAIGAAVVTAVPAPEITDITVDLAACLGRASDELAERCADAAELPDHSAAFRAQAVVASAVMWLKERCYAAHAVDAVVQWMVATISEANGVVSLTDLHEQLGLSRTRLAQRFHKHVGVLPKTFARISRFHRALSILPYAGGIADVAANAGYYDQAHMYRDFYEFAGMTPAAFLGAERYPNSLSLAEG